MSSPYHDTASAPLFTALRLRVGYRVAGHLGPTVRGPQQRNQLWLPANSQAEAATALADGLEPPRENR